ncbi:dihydroorotate dehydrogenase electron transfer subunit [Desulfovibrio aminophilus]|uniref:iron-sulfur cluster-binding protein n=1 Tax=Desulfovibrio aminophilus TaxID=81425 RepID=UPI003395AD7A
MTRRTCRELTVGELTPLGQSERPGEFYRLRLLGPGFGGWKPGQFVMLRPSSWDLELLWGRPFSLAGADAEGISVFFQVVGRGTKRLAGLAPGDRISVWGPLGNGFAVEPGTRTLMLAGGVGLAPFLGYAATHSAPGNLELLFAHRLPLSCYPYAEMAARLRAEAIHEATPADLPRIIARITEKIAEYAPGGLVLACGPTPFLRTVRQAALDLGVRTQVSLENRMACGVGACLGCVCRDGLGHHVQVCTHGPVFWAGDVQI